MRGRSIVISLATLLCIVTIAAAVFASNIVDVSTLSSLGVPVEPNAGSANVFVDPSKVIKDYVNDPAYRRGNTIQLSINISGVTDLFTYQINVTWNKAVLNVSKIVVYGDFLYRTSSPYGTSRIEPTIVASNLTGFAAIAETILGDYSGITGNGRLVTINFIVNSYGWSNITISTGGILPTTLLDHLGGTITPITVKGYFDNKLRGDVNGERHVNIDDLSAVGLAFGAGPTKASWNFNADLNKDNTINIDDLSQVGINFGRTTALP